MRETLNFTEAMCLPTAVPSEFLQLSKSDQFLNDVHNFERPTYSVLPISYGGTGIFLGLEGEPATYVPRKQSWFRKFFNTWRGKFNNIGYHFKEIGRIIVR